MYQKRKRDLFEIWKNFRIHILCHTMYSFLNLPLMTWWWSGEEAETCSCFKKLHLNILYIFCSCVLTYLSLLMTKELVIFYMCYVAQCSNCYILQVQFNDAVSNPEFMVFSVQWWNFCWIIILLLNNNLNFQ